MADLNLPKGLVVQGCTNLKDFVEVDKLALADYLLSIKNINTGAGGKVNLQNLIKSINSTSGKNLIVQGDDGKLLVSTELFKTINDVSILGSGDVFTPSQKETINSGVSTNTVSQVETNRVNISELDGRMTTAESDINTLKGRTTTAENDIDSLETRMTTAEDNINKKQDILVSGTNIKTINGNSIVGSGNVEISSTGQGQGVPIGTVYSCLCTADYIPEGALPCDGSEYTKEQFTDLWNNYLSTGLLNTCTYTEYQTAISTYGSCAKFGIITGKELNSDYTYVGNLNVSSDGIASNFSDSNYVTTPVSFTLTPESNFYYKARVKLYADISGGGQICITAFYYGDTFNNNEFQLSYLGDNGHKDFYFNLKHADGQGTIALIKVGEYFNEGDWVTVEYIKNGTTFTVKVTNDLGETHEATTENISVKTNTYTLARIGKGDDGASDYYQSDIDLSSVLIKVDNVEIFNGAKSNTFKVPTIKPNKTLIYSATSTTGLYTTIRLYSDGFCEQWGKITVSANGASTVKFDWPYKNTDYYLECAGYNTSGTNNTVYNVQNSAYWNKTATGFTCYGLTNIPKPFYACGYVNTNHGLFQDYFNNAEMNRYFVQVSNGQINQSMMDWSAWASSLQGKANTDLSNLSDSGKKVIDGQWVSKTATLSTATAVGTYTIDLSSYLPNDNYNYEVLLQAHQYSTSSTSVISLLSGILFPYNDTVSESGLEAFMMTNSYSRSCSKLEIIPIASDRKITLKITASNTSSCYLCAKAYRRIGTNQ